VGVRPIVPVFGTLAVPYRHRVNCLRYSITRTRERRRLGLYSIYVRRDGQAELSCVTGWIPRRNSCEGASFAVQTQLDEELRGWCEQRHIRQTATHVGLVELSG